MISRSIDGGRDVPAWVRRWSASDDETIRFEASARRLADALQADAPSWRALAPNAASESQRANHDQHSPRGWGGGVPRWLAVGVVAGGLLAVGWIWRLRPDVATTQPQIAIARSPEDATLGHEEVDWLLAAFGESRTSFGELVTRLDTLMTPRAPGKSIETQVDAAVTFFAYRLPASTARVAGLERASTTLGSPDSLSRFWLGKRGT
ncbi:MAG: hypothetical protein C0485_05335 [Pirellula sp.]|nr:hypothetical protein [Pirellula sp.]